MIEADGFCGDLLAVVEDRAVRWGELAIIVVLVVVGDRIVGCQMKGEFIIGVCTMYEL